MHILALQDSLNIKETVHRAISRFYFANTKTTNILKQISDNFKVFKPQSKFTLYHQKESYYIDRSSVPSDDHNRLAHFAPKYIK